MEPIKSHRSNPGTPMPTCDCGATSEETAAGIHQPNCASHDGAPDDPNDHYGH